MDESLSLILEIVSRILGWPNFCFKDAKVYS